MKIGRTIDEFQVGQRVEFSRTFTQNETETMGDLIGDHNPYHFPGPFVEKTKFKKPIVHGLLVGGMICHFGGDIFPGPGYLAESMNFQFIKPVYPGETIRAFGEVIAVDNDTKRVSFKMECYNEQNIKVLRGEVIGIPKQVTI